MDYVKIAEGLEGITGRDIADVVQAVVRNKALLELSGAQVGPVIEADIVLALESSSKVRQAKRSTRQAFIIGSTPQSELKN